MIELLIFHVHIVAALYAFTKNWQSGGVKAGILSVLIIGLFFSIGWALTATVANLIWNYSWDSIFFTSDTLGLLLLMIPETIFYYHYFLKDKSN
ncbi:MAG: hypothetical protein CVV22_03830 [Ignavibacteriae bacterium HGW-Ignavibacteriae-1]|jgi:hypothetical protein|nr:MAG: hypothetical protein CVV22_03830 [Ignavibacteriae bacterium HGW-Ignavibacteriae-1]